MWAIISLLNPWSQSSVSERTNLCWAKGMMPTHPRQVRKLHISLFPLYGGSKYISYLLILVHNPVNQAPLLSKICLWEDPFNQIFPSAGCSPWPLSSTLDLSSIVAPTLSSIASWAQSIGRQNIISELEELSFRFRRILSLSIADICGGRFCFVQSWKKKSKMGVQVWQSWH